MWAEVWIYVGSFCGLGGIAFLAWFLKMYCGGHASGKMTRRVRYSYFQALLRQDMSFFDNPKFPVGILNSRLMGDCNRVEGLGPSKISIICGATGAIITAFTIGFIYSWQLTLLCIAFMPFMAIGGMIEMRSMTQQTTEVKATATDGDKSMYKRDRETITAEVANHITTVSALNRQWSLIKEFNKISNEVYQETLSWDKINFEKSAESQQILFSRKIFIFLSPFSQSQVTFEAFHMDFLSA